MQWLFTLVMFFLFAGCGTDRLAVETSPAYQPPESDSAPSSAVCPLSFPKAGLCAEIKWTVGPTADEDSEFELRFWDKKTGSRSGPYADPTAEVGSYNRMTCCGSVTVSKVKKNAVGEYLVHRVRFLSGKWEVFVQLKSGDEIEKDFQLVELE